MIHYITKKMRQNCTEKQFVVYTGEDLKWDILIIRIKIGWSDINNNLKRAP
jgi:hypothetical protein